MKNSADNNGFSWRKKPVVIEAFQWTGDKDQQGEPQWIVDAIKSKEVWLDQYGLQIGTLEGIHTASPGDWIIRGVKGELYPCKPDIFALTYEPVVEVNPSLLAQANRHTMDLSDDFPDTKDMQEAGKYTSGADWAQEANSIDLEAADFSDALMWLKEGKRVQRAGWNGAGQWVVLIDPGNAMYTKGGASAPMQPCLGLKNAHGNMQPGWVPSMGDLMATDWKVVS